MKHISVKYRCLQDSVTRQEVWLRKGGTENNGADGLAVDLERREARSCRICTAQLAVLNQKLCLTFFPIVGVHFLRRSFPEIILLLCL